MSSKIDYASFNKAIIDEFRTNQGTVGGVFAGIPLILLTTKGAKSGKERVSPLAYCKDEDRLVIAGTYAGSDRNPAWFHNVVANPDVTVEIGTDKFEANAVRVHGAERDRLFAQLATKNPQLSTYESSTERVIPVFTLERTS